MIRGAKASGLVVTAEVAPHHFTLTDAEVASYDPVFKVNPPLRSRRRRRRGQGRPGATGIVDAIATDHAPHTQEAKELPFDQAPPGHARTGDGAGPGPHRAGPPSGADPGPAVLATGRHRRAVRRARRPDRGRGPRQPRASSTRAAKWVVDPAAMASRSRNTPYAGRALVGRARHTILRGEPVVIDGEAQR